MQEIFGYYCIISSVLYLLFGGLCFLKKSGSIVTRAWAISSMTIAVWCYGLGMLSLSSSVEAAKFWLKIHYVGAVLIPPTFLNYIYVLIGSKKSYVRQLIPWYLVAIAFLCANLFYYGSLVRISTESPFFRFYTGLGPLYLTYTIAFFLCVFIAITKLINYLRSEISNDKKNQIKWMLLATLFGFGGGSTAFFPVFNISIFPFGVFIMILYPALMSYAIIKHQLMELEVIIRRATVFAGLFAFVYAIFACFTVLGQRFYQDSFGWSEWTAIIPTILVITFALRPLEDFLTNITEKYLFQKKYDDKVLLKMFTTEILSILDLSQLPQKTIEGLDNIIKIESCSMWLRDADSDVYEVKASRGLKETNSTFNESHPLIYYFNMSHDFILKESNTKKILNINGIQDSMKELNAELCLPIIFRDKLLGFISLGMKKSGANYGSEDTDVLMALARTEAISISNAQLFNELSRTQAEAAQREKMAVIGTLAAGINHEICNPLGIARGQCEMFLLNYRDGLYKGKSQDELVEKLVGILNKVINEVDRATGITKRLSSFAKPSKRFEMGDVDVREQVEEVFAILGHELKVDNIDIDIQIPSSIPPIHADKRQIQEVIFNIVRNAAQAITGKGSIGVSAHQENGNVLIDIADTGGGIPREKLNEIFNPFFTTKEPGKGTGLGLFIVKQIVERNKGTISVDSVEGKGTTFTLAFNTSDESAKN